MLVIVSVAAIADGDSNGATADVSATAARYDLSALIQPPPTSAIQQQRDSFPSFVDALANKSFTEAEVFAKQMVVQVDVDSIDAAFSLALALHNLAIAQHFNGNYISATQNYSDALDIIAREDGNVSPWLILSLRGLAIANLDAGRPDEAILTFDRAQHVSDVNYGPQSLEQLPILNSKMLVYLNYDEPGAALEVLDRIYMLHSRRFARDSEELLPTLHQRAQVYGKLDMRAEERRAWKHILAIKQDHYAENDPALIEPNIKIAQIDIRNLRKIGYRSVTTSAAEKHLKRALRIAENSPEDNWETRKDCLLSIADFYTLFDMKGRARRYYAAAWDLLSSDGMSGVDPTKYFEAPVPLAQPKPDSYANFEHNPNRQNMGPDDYLEGEMTVEFTVDDRGRTDDLRVVEADPPNFLAMENRVRNAVEEFVYRPRYVDGKPAATSNQRYRARYFYLPSDYEAAVAKSDKLGRQRRSENP